MKVSLSRTISKKKTAAIFKDGRQTDIWQSEPEVHQPILDTLDIRLTENRG